MASSQSAMMRVTAEITRSSSLFVRQARRTSEQVLIQDISVTATPSTPSSTVPPTRKVPEAVAIMKARLPKAHHFSRVFWQQPSHFRHSFTRIFQANKIIVSAMPSLVEWASKQSLW
jgi:hypothetical protein